MSGAVATGSGAARVVAGRRTRIGVDAARDRHELPVVAGRVERQLQDAERAAAPGLAVGLDRPEGVMAPPAGTDHELPDPAIRIRDAGRRLRGESLVGVVVAGQDHIRVEVIERLVQRLHGRVIAVGGARAEARVVPHRHHAFRTACGKVGSEPLLLGGAGSARNDRAVEVRVQNDDVPGAQVVAVVALRRIARRGAEIGEVRGRIRRVVVMVAGSRPSPALDAGWPHEGP